MKLNTEGLALDIHDFKMPEDGIGPITNIAAEIITKYVELKDNIIMQSIRNISDPMHEEILIDKWKVREALDNFVKRPVEVRTSLENGRRRVHCPSCDNHQLFEYCNFCSECGQHLDWEDYER